MPKKNLRTGSSPKNRTAPENPPSSALWKTENLRRPLFAVLLLLNIAAVFTGLWYYWGQIAATSLQLLIFVPDCPLYVLLAIPILAKLVKNDSFSFLVSVGMVKYGLWTVFVLLYNWGAYSLPDFLPVTIIFIIGHFGMALEGACLLPKKRTSALAFILILGWFLLNDYADYFLGARPLIPAQGIEAVRDLTVAASFAIAFCFYFHADKIRGWLPVKLGRWLIQNQA